LSLTAKNTKYSGIPPINSYNLSQLSFFYWFLFFSL